MASSVLDRFEEVGLIDDRLFARMWVDSRQAGRQLSVRALRAELGTRGVAPEAIAEAVESVSDEDELEAARAVAMRRARSVAGLPRATQVRRLSGALARKGYGPTLSGRVVQEVLDGVVDDMAPPEMADGTAPCSWRAADESPDSEKMDTDAQGPADEPRHAPRSRW